MNQALKEKVAQATGIKLDIGCGHHKRDGWIGIDKRDVKGVDIVHDIENTPWPLETDSCITILCSHILEHVDPRNFLNIMEEMHRVSKNGAQIQISVPYANSVGALQDPTHTRPGFHEATWLYFDPRSFNGEPNLLYDIYRPSPYFIERLHWEPNSNCEVLLRVVKDPELMKTVEKELEKIKKKAAKLKKVEMGYC